MTTALQPDDPGPRGAPTTLLDRLRSAYRTAPPRSPLCAVLSDAIAEIERINELAYRVDEMLEASINKLRDVTEITR